MINWNACFLPSVVIILIVTWFLTKSWIKVAYIFEILFAIASIIIIIEANFVDNNLLSILIFLSLGLLINGIIGLYLKHK